jgi:hypothetical protein
MFGRDPRLSIIEGLAEEPDDSLAVEVPIMVDKQRDKTQPKREPKPAPGPEETESQKKTSDTVHLSAEELRLLSGGTTVIPPPLIIPNPWTRGPL